MRCLAFLLSLTLLGHAQAAPSPVEDDLEALLAEKGLVQSMGRSLGHAASDLVLTAMASLGVPYRRGGNSYDTGFDCSGFVRAIYGQTMGLLLPRRSDQQAAATRQIGRAELQPGDLVFFNTMRRAFSHVGIYVGDNKFIHSPRPGSAVRIEDMRTSYWLRRFDGARRVKPTPAE